MRNRPRRSWLLALGATIAVVMALGIAAWVTADPATAHPGNTCNPPAGHGNSGCHKVTTATTVKRTTTTAKRTVTTARPTTTAQPTTTSSTAGTTTTVLPSTTTELAAAAVVTSLPSSTDTLPPSSTTEVPPAEPGLDRAEMASLLAAYSGSPGPSAWLMLAGYVFRLVANCNTTTLLAPNAMASTMTASISQADGPGLPE
jgi:hypothetical protein